MVVKPDLVNKVKDYFGLNIYETKVWLALLSKGVASAGEIAEISGVPRSRTYDVLESLEKNGFAMQKIGKPVKYFAVKPIAVIEKLKKNLTEEMNEKINMLANIKDTKEYQELELLHSSKSEVIKKQDLSGTIRGRTNINSQISDVLTLAREEVIICVSVAEIKKRIKLLEPLLKQVSDNGIKLIIALNGADAEIKQIADRLNIKIKKIDITASFYVADKKEILFMLNETTENQEQMAVWFSSDFFVNSFTSLFEMAMKKIAAK
ncbi:MAG: helix-turn-helix domain-containing protein [Candidatus Pacearchaeota archaeon]|jgi:sugar-specific transcriptional regulator TrmB